MKLDKEIVEEIISSIQKHLKNDEIIFMTSEGPMVAKMDKFIQQGPEGVLYDLNRDLAVLYTFFKETGDIKYANDIAMANLLKYTINRLNELENK